MIVDGCISDLGNFEGKLDEEVPIQCLGLVVLDELHMISDGSRGSTFEWFITKVEIFA